MVLDIAMLKVFQVKLETKNLLARAFNIEQLARNEIRICANTRRVILL